MVDNEAKKRLGYKDPRTKVRPDGKEHLWGIDWRKRRIELLERSQGRCEVMVDTQVRCKMPGEDAHHLIPRSKGRDDRLGNLAFVCRRHHILADWKKLSWGKLWKNSTIG